MAICPAPVQPQGSLAPRSLLFHPLITPGTGSASWTLAGWVTPFPVPLSQGTWGSSSSFTIFFFHFLPHLYHPTLSRGPQQAPSWEEHCPKPPILETSLPSANRILSVFTNWSFKERNQLGQHGGEPRAGINPGIISVFLPKNRPLGQI